MRKQLNHAQAAANGMLLLMVCGCYYCFCCLLRLLHPGVSSLSRHRRLSERVPYHQSFTK